jgi:methyl-accepting chemotaxis protein
MQDVADNTGEDGPIVRELKNIAQGTNSAQAAGASATVEFDTEAMQAMAQGFFVESFDASDLYGESSADTSDYAEEEGNRNAATATATAETSAATAQATKAAAEEMTRMCEEIAAMHETLAKQTTKLSGMLNQQSEEAAKFRREQRLNKKQ